MIKNISGHTNAIHVGQAATAPNMKSATVSGVQVKYGKASEQGRHVVLDGRDLGQAGEDIHLTLNPDTDVRIKTDNHKSIHAFAGNLFIDGKKVPMEGAPEVSGPPPKEKQTPVKAFDDLVKRYPGVVLNGAPGLGQLVKIDKGVKISPGATIELTPGLEITGRSKLGSDAMVSGGKIHNSRIDGVVYDGELDRTTVGLNARVHKGKLENCTLSDHAVVKGGELDECNLSGNARVEGGVLETVQLKDDAYFKGGVAVDMEFSGKAKVTGGVFDSWKMDSGEISGGVHCGGHNPQYNAETGETERSQAFSPYINQTILNQQQYGAAAPQMMQPDYNSMMNAYNPQMMGYQQMNPYGGYQMPQTLYGNPGIVAQQSPWAGMGTGAMLGLGAGALLGMGMGGFGMGMYGLGMGSMGLGWGMGGLGMMGGMGMGAFGLGMMGFGGGWGSGLGLGGFTW